jgi:hypothetical protein
LQKSWCCWRQCCRSSRPSSKVRSRPTASENVGFSGPTLGDAIVDRIVHNAYRLELDGPSTRKLKAGEATEPPVQSAAAADGKPKGAKK